MHRQLFASVFVWILVILISGCSRELPTNQGKGETAPPDTINAAAADTTAAPDPDPPWMRQRRHCKAANDMTLHSPCRPGS